MPAFLKKLNSYSNAKAIDLRNTNQNETLNRNIRRIFSRFWKCFFLRKGYKEKEIGFKYRYSCNLSITIIFKV